MFTNTLNPILFNFGIINIRWYGLFLAIGVGLSVWLIVKLFKQKNLPVNLAFDLCTWLIIGGLVGARLGEILFYEPSFYFSHPLEMIMINHGGLSSHGMAIGLLLTFFLFIKLKANTPLIPLKGENEPTTATRQVSIINTPLEGGRGVLADWKNILDLLIIPIPLLAMFIRIGNFFNSEIVGRSTTLPWGVKFPLYEINSVSRHPTQLYEAIILLLIFNIQYLIFKKFKDRLLPLFITNLFFLLYFTSRFAIEYLKEFPAYFGLTTGQWLSLPFILLGLVWYVTQNFRSDVHNTHHQV